MLKKIAEADVTTQRKSVPEFLKANPEFAKLAKLLKIPASRMLLDYVDGHTVLEGRFDLTADLAQQLYQNYRYPENRDLRPAKADAMMKDMQSGSWSSLADPGYHFSLDEDAGTLVMTDGHQRNGTAKDCLVLNQKPLRTRVLLTTAPVDRVYIKMDRGTAKSIRARNKAGKFHEVLGVAHDQLNPLYLLTAAVYCDGGSPTSLEEKVTFDRDETRLAAMHTVRDVFLRFEQLCSSHAVMTAKLTAAGYKGLFNADLRWKILSYRSFRAAVAKVMLENPNMADKIFAFAAELLKFDSSNECDNVVKFNRLMQDYDDKRLIGGTGYHLGYNAALVCLQDYLAGRDTNYDDLVAIMNSNKGIRTKLVDGWKARQEQTLQIVETPIVVSIGEFVKTIPAYSTIRRSSKKGATAA